MNTEKAENSSKSVRRAISILNCFSPYDLDLSASDIHRKTRIPRATIYRILSALTEARLIYRNENSGRYTIGPELFVLGNLFLGTLNIVKVAEPVIKSLTEMANEAFHLGTLNKGNMVLLMREEANQEVKVALPLGTVRPAYASGMGKALLSELSEAEIDALYPEESLRPITRDTITTRTDLKNELKQIKKSGVSFDMGGGTFGATGIASVIHDASGMPIAAVGVAAPDSRLSPSRLEIFASIVRMGAGLISCRLGFKDDSKPVHDFEEIRHYWERQSASLIRRPDLMTATRG